MNAIDPNNLHESCSHHKTENQATSERNDVDSEEKYVDLKSEIADFFFFENVAEAQNPIEKTVDGVSNADIPGSSTSKPPSLDDYLDLTMKKIVQLDPILNVTTTPDVQPRNRNHGKYDTSPYIRLSKGESSVRKGSIFSRIKHPFESHNGFQVSDDLIDEFSK
uniref:Ulp1 protease family, C-terminal catalytic domain containing protein n=1 Tax=Solanum tuberosum TaxID=4113 RepID=M1DNP0_SOLTU